MTPEEAMEIDFKARAIEYQKHCDNYTPVNQKKVMLAGYAAVIEAVKQEETVAFVGKYLECSQNL